MTEGNKQGGRRKSLAWIKWTEKAVLLMKWGIDPIPEELLPVKLVFIVSGKVRKSRDLSNMQKIVEDCLVKAGVIPDDKWPIVCGIATEYDSTSYAEAPPTIRIEFHANSTLWRQTN